MPKPRYDDKKDETRHAAVDDEACASMKKKYGWDLKEVKLTETSILAVDCVFDGYCEFPPSYIDIAQGDFLKEEKEDE